MKKSTKTLCLAAATTCCMAFPAFAAETKGEYKADAAPIRTELQNLEQKMEPLRAENKTSATTYKATRLAYKNDGSLSIDKADWKKAKELHKEIAAIRTEMKPTGGALKALRTEAKAEAKAGNYNAALDKLENAVQTKESRLKNLEKINEIWEQIDQLLQ